MRKPCESAHKRDISGTKKKPKNCCERSRGKFFFGRRKMKKAAAAAMGLIRNREMIFSNDDEGWMNERVFHFYLSPEIPFADTTEREFKHTVSST